MSRLSEALQNFIADFLDISEQPEQDRITFVYAGRLDRKIFGWYLYESRFTGNIIFSVGRFEWRKFLNFRLRINDNLINLVNRTPPGKRHFFVEICQDQQSVNLIPVKKLGTYGESIALLKLIKKRNIRKINVISSSFHLRRSTMTLWKFSLNLDLEINPVAVPPNLHRLYNKSQQENN